MHLRRDITPRFSAASQLVLIMLTGSANVYFMIWAFGNNEPAGGWGLYIVCFFFAPLTIAIAGLNWLFSSGNRTLGGRMAWVTPFTVAILFIGGHILLGLIDWLFDLRLNIGILPSQIIAILGVALHLVTLAMLVPSAFGRTER